MVLKRILATSLAAASLIACLGTACAAENKTESMTYLEKVEQKSTAHDIAELARSLGLPEDDPIILRAKELWHSADDAPADPDELAIIANVVWNEAGYCTDRHQQLVAQVILNRVMSDKFPDTVREVIAQPRQYSVKYLTPDPDIPERCFANALAAINGDVVCPANVLYQSNYPDLGSGHYEVIYTDTGWFKSTSYFSYG